MTVNNIIIKQGFIDAIGNTPLIRLKQLSDETGCEILGKAEFLNPGGSVKDRAALGIIEDAEKKGLLKPGGTIVEGTAGNTGIGIALVANAKGYNTKIIIPDTQSKEKFDMLRSCGAEVIAVPAVPYKDENNYIKISKKISENLNKEKPGTAVWANQFDNLANKYIHFKTTGPEIWKQTNERIDGFICSVGTGGTLSGVASFLKSRNPNIKIGLADPMGASLYNYFVSGELKANGKSITEGIGQGRITENLKNLEIDSPFQIDDVEAMHYVFRLIKEEGLILGGSSGINIAGAIRLAKQLGPGKTIVTILCDLGSRYQSKIFNPKFLKSNSIPVPNWLL
ncbi:MAG: Cysteine synthase [Alphaproteobacteria bacterium MarineAlpha2_Bin1]|nr:MAG: Cysteine synthase [Alphaproteobacteria bacterium MarineAlpha2_Bin1]